jgi:hypothetical protein
MTNTKKAGRSSKDELLQALEDAHLQEPEDDGDGLEISEAERLAAHADAPVLRADGKPVGSDNHQRVRPLTVSQMLFAQGLIQGKTYKQAYKDAYPNSGGTDASITTSAYKLSRDARIAVMVQDALEETAEHLSEDRAATQRYVLRQLVAHSKQAKQEGTKLKALELLGKSAGLFTQADADKPDVVTAEQLKRELGMHLKLVRERKTSA